MRPAPRPATRCSRSGICASRSTRSPAPITSCSRTPSASDATTPDALRDTLRAAHGIPVTPAAHAWDGIDLFRGAENPGERVAAPWLNGREVALVCGIGNPRAFVAMVEGAGAEIAARRILADHRAIDPDDIRGMLGSMGGSGERVVVMTRKDRARLAARGGGPEALGARAVIAVPRLSIRFPEGSEELDGACAGVF